MSHGVHPDPLGAAAFDACWNRIGTQGDGSCPRLIEHSRCPNCPVFEQAAASLLDRPLEHAGLADMVSQRAASVDTLEMASPANTQAAAVHSALVFRIADEWLALSTVALLQVDDTRPVHSLPHQRNRVVLGLVNVHGVLTIAASLGEMLHLDHAASGRQAARNGYARMLVVAHRGQSVAFPVDEVEGVFRFALAALMPVPTTLAHAAAKHTCGVLAWRDRTIGLLDTDCICESLIRSLR